MDLIRQQSQKITGMLKALIAAYLVSAVLLILLAVLLWKLNLKEGQVTVGILLTYLLSCFLGGRVMGKAAGTRRFLWGLLAGICYFLLLMGASAIFLPGGMAGAKTIVTTLCLCGCGGMAGGMLA